MPPDARAPTERFSALALAERGRLPDAAIRWGIRRALRERLLELTAGGSAASAARQQAFLAALARSPLALATEAANAQHYELPPAFFEAVLGPRLKYSCALFAPGIGALAEAELRMLELSAERAGIEDGMDILELGCGWGSFALWTAEVYPRCRVLAISNSKDQREYILAECRRRGIASLEVRTADMNGFDTERRFDRVVSIEMFEHMRNWPLLLARIGGWLRPGGRAFVHHFCHRSFAYPYEDRGPGDWMARHFFSGGMMPSEDLLERCAGALAVEARWRVDGLHYQRTCEAWLCNLDARREALLAILARAGAAGQAARLLGRWRLFFLACAELFGFRGGREWFVSHARLAPRAEIRS